VVQFGAGVSAVGEDAVAVVAEVGGASDGGAEFVVGDTDVEDVAGAAEDDGDDFGVAGESSDRVRC